MDDHTTTTYLVDGAYRDTVSRVRAFGGDPSSDYVARLMLCWVVGYLSSGAQSQDPSERELTGTRAGQIFAALRAEGVIS